MVTENPTRRKNLSGRQGGILGGPGTPGVDRNRAERRSQPVGHNVVRRGVPLRKQQRLRSFYAHGDAEAGDGGEDHRGPSQAASSSPAGRKSATLASDSTSG